MDVFIVLRILAVSIPVTFLLEALILRAFGFTFRSNWKPLLIIVVCSVVGLQLYSAAGFVFTVSPSGLFWSQFLYGGIELAVFAVKAVLFAFLLKQHTKLRRVLFSLAASAVSYFIGMGLVFGLMFLRVFG